MYHGMACDEDRPTISVQSRGGRHDVRRCKAPCAKHEVHSHTVLYTIVRKTYSL